MNNTLRQLLMQTVCSVITFSTIQHPEIQIKTKIKTNTENKTWNQTRSTFLLRKWKGNVTAAVNQDINHCNADTRTNQNPNGQSTKFHNPMLKQASNHQRKQNNSQLHQHKQIINNPLSSRTPVRQECITSSIQLRVWGIGFCWATNQQSQSSATQTWSATFET